MKIILTPADVQALYTQYHGALPLGAQLVISRPRKKKAKSEIFTLTPVRKLSDELFNFIAKIEECLKARNLIGAIKEYRSNGQTALVSLKDAKDLVEAWNRTRRYIETNHKIPEFYSELK